MLTQRGRLFDDVEDLKKKMGGMRIPRMLLKKLLDEAQNPPPQGAADGTIPEDMWGYARGLISSLASVEAAIEALELIDQRLPGKRTTDG
jgi:hypothetical protein